MCSSIKLLTLIVLKLGVSRYISKTTIDATKQSISKLKAGIGLGLEDALCS